jgi:hypothetical protein
MSAMGMHQVRGEDLIARRFDVSAANRKSAGLRDRVFTRWFGLKGTRQTTLWRPASWLLRSRLGVASPRPPSSHPPGSGSRNDRVMELYKLHMLTHPPELPDGPATYQLMIAREASTIGSVQSLNFPAWDSLARKLASIGVGDGELQKAKRELDVNRYYSIMGVSLSHTQIQLLGFIRKPAPTPG